MKPIPSLLATAFLAALALTSLPTPAGTPTSPNVVVIISDDGGFADWEFMDAYIQTLAPAQAGSPVPTPSLNTLRNRGVLFTNAYTASVCSPSRACIVTGSYQQRIGYEFNINNLTGATAVDGLHPDTVTIFDRMKAEGYTTGAIGKWHLGARAPDAGLGNRPENQGVDEFFGIWKGSRNYTVGGATGTDQLRETIADPFSDTVLETTAPWNTSSNYVTNAFGQGAVAFIDRHYADPDPFFLYVSFTSPHGPIGPSPDYNDPRITGITDTKRREYASMVLTMDKEVGNILAKLDDPAGDGSVSLTDNTLVIFINDNGGASGIGTINDPLRNFKGSTYEGGNRVPMLIAGPGVPSNPTTPIEYHAPVHSIDILPTCLQSAGGAPVPGMDGVNLIPFIDGTDTGIPHEVLTIRNDNRVGVRKGDWKLTKSGGGSVFALYDLATDIGETNDVSGANPAVVGELLRDFTIFEAGADKPRHAGLNDPADSINLNDHFILDPQPSGVVSFTPDLTLVGGATLNGDFNAGGGTGAQTYAQTPEWENIGTGDQTSNATQTTLDANGTRNAIIAESATRALGLDTGHTLATGEAFRATYQWRDASNWTDGSDRIRVTLFTTDDDTIAGTRTDLQFLNSSTSTADSTYQNEAAVFDPVPGSADGKRLFVEINAAQTGGGFARLDDFVLERGTVSGGGGAPTTLTWADGDVWKDADTNGADTLLATDAFAGAVFEFPVTDSFSYTATNLMLRRSGLDFMLNQLRLTGSFGGTTPRSATIDGNDLLFTNDLAGAPPTIGATADGPDFSYTIANNLILFDDLTVSGNGDAAFELSGAIQEYFDPRGLTKDGSSTILLSGTPTYAGPTNIARGTLLLDSGVTLTNSTVNIALGGILGGNGTVTNNVTGPGAVAPGQSIGTLTIAGNASPGSLIIEVDGSSADRLDVAGTLDLTGAKLSLIPLAGGITGPVVIARYGSLTGTFASFTNLPAGYGIDYAYNDGMSANNIALVTTTPATPTAILVDYDDFLANGIHDSAVLNGGFEANIGPSGAQLLFGEADDWVSYNNSTGTGFRDNLAGPVGGPWNAVIDESDNRIPSLDTRYIVAADAVFDLGFDWRDASNWNDSFDWMRATLFTTADDTLTGTVEESVQLLSAPSLLDTTWQRESTTVALPPAAAGKRLFLSLTGLDGSGSNVGFARLDNVYLAVTTSTPPTPYETWITGTNSGGSNAFEDDPNKDGIANGLAFFISANDPGANARNLLPVAEVVGDHLEFQFLRSDNAASLSYEVEYSNDLDQWDPAVSGQNDVVIVETDNGPTDIVTVILPTDLAFNPQTGRRDYLFARLVVLE